jgi:hypothetical protein
VVGPHQRSCSRLAADRGRWAATTTVTVAAGCKTAGELLAEESAAQWECVSFLGKGASFISAGDLVRKIPSKNLPHTKTCGIMLESWPA